MYIYRVSTNLCLKREYPLKIRGTETDAKNGMIGDGHKHRAITWYLHLLLLLDMVLSNGRCPLFLHRASSHPTLHKPTFPSIEQTGSIHMLWPVSAHTSLRSIRSIMTRTKRKPTVPCCQQVCLKLQLLLATCASWATWATYLKIISVKNMATNQLNLLY